MDVEYEEKAILKESAEALDPCIRRVGPPPTGKLICDGGWSEYGMTNQLSLSRVCLETSCLLGSSVQESGF